MDNIYCDDAVSLNRYEELLERYCNLVDKYCSVVDNYHKRSVEVARLRKQLDHYEQGVES